ncbi:hypothetical protein [Nitrospira sp. BLG_1]|uniref:hypothetical protein n=1 Tax=Nitrospira sp. BLG_1 TaxID=3395883 RepID=UPI0039BCF5C0
MPEGTEETTTTESTTSTTPPPVSREEFTALQTGMQQAFEGINASLQALAAARNTQVGAPHTTPAEPSLEDIAAEFEQGNTKAGLAKVVGLIGSREEKWKQTLQATQDSNTRSLAAMAREMAMGSRKADGTPRMKHYEKYKKEIEAALANAHPDDLKNPNAYFAAYSFIVGQHMDEIEEEARRGAVRGDRDRDTGGSTGQTSRTTVIKDDTQTANGLSQEELTILESMGRTPEQYAKSWGYNSVEELVKARKAEGVKA